MTQQTITWPVTKDAFAAQEISGGTSYGSAKCPHNALGRSINGYGPVRQRAFLDFTEKWVTDGGATAKQIVKAELKMRRTTSAQHVNPGGSAYVRAQRTSAAWTAGNRGSDEQLWTDNALEWSTQPGVTGSVSPATAVPGSGAWISVDISAIIDEIAPSEVKKRDGNPGTNGSLASGGGLFDGLRVIPTDSGGTEQNDTSNQASEFFSLESSSDPYILLTVDDNEAPAVPTINSPEQDAIASSPTGLTAVIAGSYSDPEGNPFGGGTIQVWNDAATDDGAGNITAGTQLGSNISMVAGDGAAGLWSKTITGLPAQTWVKVRAQVKDNQGAYSIYSPLRRFKTNATPGVPSNPYFQDDTVTNPAMAASITDADAGATISAYEPEVYYDHPTLGAIIMWAPGDIALGGSSTRANFTYQGDQLVIGTKYRWRIRLYDNNGVPGAWTADLFVTPRTATGPSNMTPRDLETKQNTKTPTLSIDHGGTTFDQAAWDVFDNADGTGTPLWTVPTQTFAATETKAFTYGDNTGLTGASTAAPLDWGKRYYWRAAIRVTGQTTIGSYSPLYPFYINALPAAPALGVSA